jgi:hypothetical protein
MAQTPGMALALTDVRGYGRSIDPTGDYNETEVADGTSCGALSVMEGEWIGLSTLLD